ncbi:hypothetical protein [Streptomyces niphimycinicus]|uniref:hypothetical protein n=1 Tax=Streptomyces niphimycinicus TaxID=2842201 RepID=UPI00209B3E33|nr:hypothetical protein [Streptomyces niphimycinicus]
MINNQTATKTSRVSNHWISASMRGQDATPERLRVDRQLEEALTHGPDPLHLAEVFGLDEKTAMRYADSARASRRAALTAVPCRRWSRIHGPGIESQNAIAVPHGGLVAIEDVN